MSRHRARQESHSKKKGDRSSPPSKRAKKQNRQPSHKLVAPTVALTVALTSANALAGEQEKCSPRRRSKYRSSAPVI